MAALAAIGPPVHDLAAAAGVPGHHPVHRRPRARALRPRGACSSSGRRCAGSSRCSSSSARASAASAARCTSSGAPSTWRSPASSAAARPCARRRSIATPTTRRSSRSASGRAIPWTGGTEALFYAYTVPEPAGLSAAPDPPGAARWSPTLKEFVLPYDDVRRAARSRGRDPRLRPEHLRRGRDARGLEPRGARVSVLTYNGGVRAWGPASGLTWLLAVGTGCGPGLAPIRPSSRFRSWGAEVAAVECAKIFGCCDSAEQDVLRLRKRG